MNDLEEVSFSMRKFLIEDDIKKESKGACEDIEEEIGMVQFFLRQDPMQKSKLIEVLQVLSDTNLTFA